MIGGTKTVFIFMKNYTVKSSVSTKNLIRINLLEKESLSANLSIRIFLNPFKMQTLAMRNQSYLKCWVSENALLLTASWMWYQQNAFIGFSHKKTAKSVCMMIECFSFKTCTKLLKIMNKKAQNENVLPYKPILINRCLTPDWTSCMK